MPFAFIFDVSLQGESLEVIRETKDAAGTITERLKETYKEIEVYDAVVTVRKAEDGELTGEATGMLIQEIEKDLPDTEAILTDEETLNIAINAEGDDVDEISYVNYTREIYIDDNNRARLVNILSYLIDGVKRPFYIIDVKNGEILKHWQGLNNRKCRNQSYKATGGNSRTGKIPYGEKPYCLQPKIVNGECFLENKYVRVIDMKNENHSDYSLMETARFDCNNGYHDESNGAYSPAIDAFFYGSVVGGMFKEWFGSKPLREKIVIRVHYGSLYENAFWDGLGCTFGDGGDYLYPLTSLDIIGHEIAHGVTEQGSRLVYEGESGGVDEAFSDIIGEAAEAYLKIPDFMTGRNIMKHEPYLREFEHPENDKKSISNVDDMEESMDPHYSSGVYRRVFYVVVKEGMPIRYAAAVFLHANRMFWHSLSSFHDCSCGVLKAALDLGYDTLPFRKAFKDVGLARCEVSQYVFTLSNNKTRSGIEVSGIVNPIFKLEAPLWAEDFIVSVDNNYGHQIQVTVTTGGWEQYGDGDDMVHEVGSGINSITIPNAKGKEFFVKLSMPGHGSYSDELPVVSVDLTGGYSCRSDYVADTDTSRVYKRDCRKRRKSKKKFT